MAVWLWDGDDSGMAYRNWKQEFDDLRPPPPSPWPLIGRAASVLAVSVGVVAAALWIWPGYLRERPWQRPGPPPKRLALVFVSNQRGYFETSGPVEQPGGGLARMKTALDQTSCLAARLLCDVGGMTSGGQRWQRLGLERYLEALARMGFTVANLGPEEAALGADELCRLAAASPVPLISANVCDALNGHPLLPTHHQVTIHNLRVTFVGVSARDDRCPPGPGLTITDIDQALGQLLPQVRPQTDLVVLLADCDETTIRQLALKHPELGVILGGRVQQASREVEWVGSCRLVWQNGQGQMLGRVDVDISDDGLPERAVCSTILLGRDVPDEASMVAFVQQYNDDLAALYRAEGPAGLGVPPRRVPPGGPGTAGGGKACRSCHAQAAQAWDRSAHARAYATLTKRRRDSNPECLRCHVLDLWPGGEDAAAMVNVQCESCHGSGARHVQARKASSAAEVGRMAPATEAVCQGCHDCTHSPSFAFDAYWEKIKHGRNATP